MKNKILQEQKMMLSLMGYERGRTTFENQQLNEWGVWDAITDFAEEDELEESKMLWDNLIASLKQILGSG